MAALIGGIIAALGAAASAYNTHEVAKKQDNIAADGIRQQAKTQQEANQRINKTIAETKASTADPYAQTANQKYLQAIQQHLSAGTAGLATRGLSEQYDQMATGGAAQAQDYAGTIAGLLSRIDSGTQQRQAEGNMQGQLGYDLLPMAANINGDAFLNNLKLKGVQRNPWIDLAAAGASAYGSAYGSGAWGSGTGNAKVVDSTMKAGRGYNTINLGTNMAGYT